MPELGLGVNGLELIEFIKFDVDTEGVSQDDLEQKLDDLDALGQTREDGVLQEKRESEQEFFTARQTEPAVLGSEPAVV